MQDFEARHAARKARRARLLDEAEDVVLVAERAIKSGNDPVASAVIGLISLARIGLREARADLQDD